MAVTEPTTPRVPRVMVIAAGAATGLVMTGAVIRVSVAALEVAEPQVLDTTHEYVAPPSDADTVKV
jgi:hypothetical protein